MVSFSPNIESAQFPGSHIDMCGLRATSRLKRENLFTYGAPLIELSAGSVYLNFQSDLKERFNSYKATVSYESSFDDNLLISFGADYGDNDDLSRSND